MPFVMFVLLCWSILCFGLYFPEHQHLFLLFLAGIVGCILLYKQIRGEKIKIAFYYLLIPLVVLLPLLKGVETIQGTIEQFLLIILFLLFGICILFVHEKHRSEKLQVTLLIFHYLFTIGTWIVLIYVKSFPHFVLSLSTEVSGLGERLGGFIQYPNAFGALLSGMILYHLLFLAEKRSRIYGVSSVILPMLMPLLLLTESRGAWLLLAVCWLVSFYFIKSENQLRYIISTIFTIISGLMIYLTTISEGEINPGLQTISLLLLFSLISYFLEKLLTKEIFLWKGKVWVLPIGVSLVTLFLILDSIMNGIIYNVLPNSIQRRLSFGMGTFHDRVYYWKDVLHNVKDIGFLGNGGDAWTYLMYRVQTFPYITKELHNEYLTIFIETGIQGLIVSMVVIFIVGKNLLLRKSIVFPVFCLVLLHACIDFTLSFPMIVLWVIVLVASEMGGDPKYSSVNTKEKVTLRKYKGIASYSLLWMYIGVSFYFSFTFLKADEAFKAAAVESRSLEEAKQSLQLAIERNHWNPKYLEFAIQNEMYTLEELESFITEGIKYTPNQGLFYLILGNVNEEKEQFDLAEKYYLKSLSIDPFDSKKYEAIGWFYLHQAERAMKDKNDKQLAHIKKKIKKIYLQAEKLQKDTTSNKSLRNQRDYKMTNEFLKIYHKINEM